MKRAKPRREREYPQVARVFSTNFPDQLERHKGTCFVPLEDYNVLMNKYHKMFLRYSKQKGK